MVFLKTHSCLLVIVFTLVKSAAVIMCPPSTSVKLKTFCHHSQVSVPFPFECDAIPINFCHNAENLLKLKNSTQFYLDGNRIFGRAVIGDCWNDSATTYSNSGHWQIKFDSIQNIYVVLVRTLGPARNQQLNSLRVSLSRRVSSDRSETTQCHDFEYFDGFHIFYCYHPDEALTSSYRPGFDAQFVDIVGEIYIDDSCDFTNIVKIYSYPVRVCGIPEAHYNQTIEPDAHYYLIGQLVTYRCSDDAHTLIGRPDRVCQYNGLWSGSTPTCVLVHNVQPQSKLINLMGNTESYWPANSLAKATRIDEMGVTTYGFGAEYCIKRILLEYHSELSVGTDLSVYTTSIDGTRHSWTANGSFGFYANKQYFLPEDQQPFVCCLNVTIQRHPDRPARGILKRFEFIYQIEAAGYHQLQSHCLTPRLFPNVKFNLKPNHTIENGVTVKLECTEGFRQQNTDPAEIQCENEIWKGSLPICEREFKQFLGNPTPSEKGSHCPQPRKRSHSSWKYLENKGLQFNQVLYKCNHGFEPQGRSLATCLDGRWSSPSITCKVTFCPSVTMPPNLFCMLNRKNEFYDASDNGTAFHHGIGLVCYCHLGFRVKGNTTIDCDNQQWSSELPICEEILCGSPPILIPSDVNNSILMQRHWQIGVHNFTCPQKLGFNGYDDRTSMELICQENGEWGGTEVFECVNQGNGFEYCEIASIVTGGILGVILVILVSAVFIVKRKANETLRINESKRNLTIVEYDYNASYISYSEEMDDGCCLALVDGNMTKDVYSICYTESSESEIDVEN